MFFDTVGSLALLNENTRQRVSWLLCFKKYPSRVVRAEQFENNSKKPLSHLAHLELLLGNIKLLQKGESGFYSYNVKRFLLKYWKLYVL